MKLIPIISIENKFLGIHQIDLAIYLIVQVVVEFFKSLSPFIFGVGLGNATLYWGFGLFLLFELFKNSLEKKEQNLFMVLFQNARIPNIVIGSFWKRIIIGVRGKIG